MDELLTGLRDVLTARYLIVATVSFQIYDYIISLNDEVHLIWTSKIGLRHVHFFLNRYAPFATSFLALHYVVLKKDLEGCTPGFGSLVFTTVIGMLIAELTVFLRVDAVWGHKPLVRFLLGGSYLCSCSVILYFASTHFMKNHVLQLHYMSGCLYVHDDRMIWVALLAYTLCELVALVLLLTKAFLGFRLDNSPVMKNLYQDGILYFSIITISTIANFVLLLTASSTLSDAFLVPESVLVNVLCSHMHLRIRKSHLRTLHGVNDALGIELRAPIFASFERSQSDNMDSADSSSRCIISSYEP